MALFDFRTPNRVATGTVQFIDESGRYTLGDLLDRVWIEVTHPIPGANWFAWYGVLARLVTYARLEAPYLTIQDVSSWPACPETAGVAAHPYGDEWGNVTVAEMVRAIDGVIPTHPTLAKRLTRTIVYLAARDQERDRTAHRLLEQAGLLDGGHSIPQG